MQSYAVRSSAASWTKAASSPLAFFERQRRSEMASVAPKAQQEPQNPWNQKGRGGQGWAAGRCVGKRVVGVVGGWLLGRGVWLMGRCVVGGQAYGSGVGMGGLVSRDVQDGWDGEVYRDPASVRCCLPLAT